MVNQEIVDVVWASGASAPDDPSAAPLGPEAALVAAQAAALQGQMSQDEKQELLDKVVKEAVQHFAAAGPPPVPASERPVLSYDDI